MSQNIKRVEIAWTPGHKDGPRFAAFARFSVESPGTPDTLAGRLYGRRWAWGHCPPLVALLAALNAFEPEYRAGLR